MKLFSKSYDGGPDSGVTGYWLVECKPIASVVLLHFSPGSRDAYHSHAFNAITLWLRGDVVEESLTSSSPMADITFWTWRPGQFKYTPRGKFHKIVASEKGAWALSIRGPWRDTWEEFKHNKLTQLTHGRRILQTA